MGSILVEPPIVVLADDGPLVFETVHKAELYLEPIDIQNQEYRAFDSGGRELTLSTAIEVRGRLLKSNVEVTKITLDNDVSKADELQRQVLAWVNAHYSDRLEEFSGSTLREMIKKLVEWLGYQE